MPLRSAIRSWVYDRFVAGMTSEWYRHVLTRLADGARVLDVGIGTGAALARCADLVQAKRLDVVGLDIDQDYLVRCQAEVTRVGLTDQVRPVLSSVYEHEGGPYDVVVLTEARSIDELGKLIVSKVQLVPGITRTVTCSVVHL